MTILALEFSSPLRGVAVAVDGVVRAEVAEQGGRETHAFQLIERVLREAGLAREEVEGIAVGTGPGSYAGIRIAIAIAQGWGLARGVKLMGISSADGVAAQVTGLAQGEKFSIVIDAQRGEFFAARYHCTAVGPRLIRPFQLMAESDWSRPGETIFRPDMTAPDGRAGLPLPPSASALARLAAARGEHSNDSVLEPIYLRPAAFIKAPPSRFAF